MPDANVFDFVNLAPRPRKFRGPGPPVAVMILLAVVAAIVVAEGPADDGQPPPPHVEDALTENSLAKLEDEVDDEVDAPADTPSERIVVDGDRLVVPIEDLAYGRAPAQPIPPGTYELALANHGARKHTLVNDALGVDLHARAAPMGRDVTVARTRVRLAPGTYTFYCRLPGHRSSGMEFDLAVGPAQGATPP